MKKKKLHYKKNHVIRRFFHRLPARLKLWWMNHEGFRDFLFYLTIGSLMFTAFIYMIMNTP